MSVKRWGDYLLALRAIFRRDMIMYFRYPVNVVFNIFEPFVWMLPVYFLARSFMVGGENLGFEAYSGTTDFISFWIIGGIMSFYINSVMWGMGFSLKNEMWLGVIETNWLTSAPVLVQLIGRSLWGLALTTFNGSMALLIAWKLFGFSFGGQIVPALLTMVPMLIGLYGLGFGLAAVVLISNDANNVIDISSFIIRTFSGQEFPVTVLPRILMTFSLILPVTYAFDAVRGYLIGTKTLLPMTQEQLILLAVMALFVSVGYAVFRRVERSVRTAGNLGHH